MRFSKWSWDALLIASIVFVAGLCAQSQQVAHAEDDTQPEGKIVRIAPDPGSGVAADSSLETKTTTVEEPAYWIGISGRGVESPVLRTHLQLAEDMGVVVERVVPDSPADKAGLRRHDIILRANGAGVHGIKILQDHVRAHQAKPLELKIIRLGKEETVVVVPEERPEKFNVLQAGQRQGPPDALRGLMERLQLEGGLPGGMRRIDPGDFFHGQLPARTPTPQEVELNKRLERMEQELRDLQKRLSEE